MTETCTAKLDKISVHLRISGFVCDPDTITEILGLPPSRTWRKGEALTHTEHLQHRDNGWEIRSASRDAVFLESHVTDIVRVIQPVRDRFKQLPIESAIVLTCAISVYPDAEMPSIFFDAATVRLLGEINAEVDIDLHCVDEITSPEG